MRAVRVLLLLVLVLAVSLASAAAAPSTGLLGLTPDQVLARLGRTSLAAIYRPTPSAAPIYTYCVGGAYYPSYYDVTTGAWVRERTPRRFGGDTYGPCRGRDRAHPDTLLVRYDRGRVTAVGYVTAHGSARDQGWLAALDRIAVGFDPRAARGVAIARPSGADLFPRVLAARRYSAGVLLSLEPAIGSIAVVWYAPSTPPDLSPRALRRDPLVATILHLDQKYRWR